MFFEVPGWNLGKPVADPEPKKKIKNHTGGQEKRVSFAIETKDKGKEKSLAKPKPSPFIAQEEEVLIKKKDKGPRAEPKDLSIPVEKKITKPTASGKSSVTDKLKAKLSGARFRFLNQKLYESSSQEALKYFGEHQDDFLRYHEGFKEQTLRWPTNPVDVFIGRLMEMKTVGGKLVAVDMGCGEGKLGSEVEKSRGGQIKVHSFDLVSVADHIQVASMTNVPLKNASVELVIFSLSLMNTDFGDALREANRILKANGQLWIAEVESRFDAGKGGVDGFVKELGGLGFHLKGSVDRSHKVFVLMEFVKKGEAKAKGDGLSLKSCKYKKR